MEKLLRFHDMIDSLSTKEYKQFITDVTKDKDSFKALLFNSFRHQIFSAQYKANDNSDENVDEINAILKTIIESRKPHRKSSNKQTPIIQNEPITFHEIPNGIILFISSYLPLLDNINFAKTSRNIFIASRSPMRMYSITRQQMDKFNAYFTYNTLPNLAKRTMNRLKFACRLSVDCDHLQCMTHLSDNTSLWNNLDTLELYSCQRPLDLEFWNGNNMQSSNINGLSFGTNFGTETEFEAMIDILTGFNNLQYLWLHVGIGTVDTDQLNQMINIQSLSNIKGLALDYVLPESISNVLLHAFSEQLESLHIAHNDGVFCYIRESFPAQAAGYKFTNLKELCVEGDIYPEDGKILNTINANKLERVQINMMNLCNDDIKYDHIIDLLCSPSLEYIKFNESMCSALEILNTILKVKRTKLRIELRLVGGDGSDETLDEVDSVENQTCLDNVFKMMTENTEHFMFILQKQRLSNDYLTALQERYRVNEYNKKVVISNMECNLNGYHAKWLMKCECCKDC
eukprot:856848_1